MSDSHVFICEAISPDNQPLKVDRDKSIVYNVKIAGMVSGNRRRYKHEAYANGYHKYEGAIGYVNHTPALQRHNPPGGIKSYEKPSFTERFCRYTGVTYKPNDGIYAAEMHCDPGHPFTKSFLWWAENAPDKLALSHVVKGKFYHDTRSNEYVWESIEEVASVDVVEKGGTTRTIFESAPEMNEHEELGQYVRTLIGDSVSLSDAKTHIANVFKSLPPREFKGTVAEAMTALQSCDDPRVRIVVESLDERLAKEAQKAIRDKAEQACKDAKLPQELITGIFVESLTRDAEDNWKATIEDRRKLIVNTGESPRTLGGNAGEITFDQFVENVRKGR